MKIDCSGLACPEPVLQTKKALESLPNDSILEVVVDNIAARENVVRFAQNGGFETRLESLEEGKTLISIIKGFACQIIATSNDDAFLDKTLFLKRDLNLLLKDYLNKICFFLVYDLNGSFPETIHQMLQHNIVDKWQ